MQEDRDGVLFWLVVVVVVSGGGAQLYIFPWHRVLESAGRALDGFLFFLGCAQAV